MLCYAMLRYAMLRHACYPVCCLTVTVNACCCAEEAPAEAACAMPLAMIVDDRLDVSHPDRMP